VTNATQTVGRNAAVQVAGRAAAAVLGLALAAVLTRALGVEEFGSLSTALAVLGILAVLHDLGTTTIASRTLARDADAAEPVLGSLVVLRLGAAVPLALVGAFALWCARESGAFLWWAAAVYAVVLAGRAIESVDVVLQVAQKMGRSVAANLAGRSAHLVGVLALWGAGVCRPGPMLAAAAIGVIASCTLRVGLVRPWFRLRLRWVRSRLAPFLREAAPTGLAAVLMVLYLHADALLVRGISGAREAAFYNAPYRLFLLGAGLTGMVMLSAAPILSARWTADRNGFRRGVHKLLLISIPAALAVAGLVALTARPLLGLLFGADYEAAAPTLVWLAFAAAATAPGTIATSALISANRAGWAAGLAAAALLGNVGLDILLVPGMGGRGAAVATFATEILVAVGGCIALRRAMGRAA
jgi:O-antigen/teichoic acid export membrane protein